MYDLFQSNLKYYEQGGLWRLFKHLELRMADQLGESVARSLTNWVHFVKESTSEGQDLSPSCAAARRLPLFDVCLVFKDDQVTLEPSAAEIENVLTQAIDEMAPAVRSLQTIDSAIMALLHLPVSVQRWIVQGYCDHVRLTDVCWRLLYVLTFDI